jgi:hypothetical protein
VAKGDIIDVTYRTPVGIQSARVEARQNGRKVEYELTNEQKLSWVVVKEVTRGGTTVMEARFIASEVLAVRTEKKEIT